VALINIAPKLHPEDYERNFADISPRLTRQQALLEAARCLYCYGAPCTSACPTHIDVASFIRKIATSNLKGSERVILTANIWARAAVAYAPRKCSAKGPAS